MIRTFLNNENLDETSSLSHLLNNLNESRNDCEEANLDLKQSYYYDVEQFINILQKFDDGISILSTNIRSIQKQFDELCVLLSRVSGNSDIKVICLQEETDTAPFQIPVFSLISRSRTCCMHGGLLIYIHNSLTYKIMENNYLMTNWECVSIEILRSSNSQSNIYATNVYNKHC